jgi:hypothetical protein
MSVKWSMVYADKGFAPIYTGHEPGMLLLHQSTVFILIRQNTFALTSI